MSNLIDRKNEAIRLLDSKELGKRLETLLDKKQLEKFKSNVISICMDNSLQDCSISSIVKSAKTLAELGLDINPLLSNAYIVKYKKDAQPIIGYKGYITLAERYGKRIKAYCVFKCDDFLIDYSGREDNVRFIPNILDRNETDKNWFNENILGVLVKIIEKLDYYHNFVSTNKIKQIVGMAKGKDSSFSPYNNWFEEMYLAKAIKYVLSRMPMNETIQSAINIDNDIDTELVEMANNVNSNESKNIINDIIDKEESQEESEEDSLF